MSQTATAVLRFSDGTEERFELKRVLELQLPSKRDLSVIHTPKGGHMVVTTGMLQGRKLADDFLSIRKNAEDGRTLYTVHLLYPDYMAEEFGKDDHMTSVWAKDPEEAFREAVQEVRQSHDVELQGDHDMHVLGIYEGSVKDLNPWRNQ